MTDESTGVTTGVTTDETTDETTDGARTTFGPLTIWYDATGLRPRPWTELQSAWAAELLRGLPEGDLLELCAGAGQIGLLALVRARDDPRGAASGRRLVQVDEDETVCRLAERNAALAGLAEQVDVRRGLPVDVLRPDERFVLALADPPWVPSDRVEEYPEDPPGAIDGGPDGLDVVRALLPVLERHLQAPGAALLQVGGRDQVGAVRELLERTGSTLEVVDHRDAPGEEDGAVALLRHRAGAPATRVG